MARQTARPHRQAREVNQSQRRKTAQTSSTNNVLQRYMPQQAPSVERPIREAPNAKDAQNFKCAKTKQTVSAAGVFKKKSKVNPHDRKQPRRREVREPTPELDLIAYFHDGVEIARDDLKVNAKANFDDLHTAFSERLTVSKGVDDSFVKELGQATAALSASLLHERIETMTSKDGKRKSEIVEIGKRLAAFKKLVDKEEGKLKEAWKHWEELQNEYIELGVEVFGLEVFGEAASGSKADQKGFRRDLNLLNLEHNARLTEFDEEIEDTSPTFLQKMKTSEKELDSAAKKEQARVLQALIQD